MPTLTCAGARLQLLAGLVGSAGLADGVGIAARFNGCSGIAADPTTNTLVIADTRGNAIRRVDPATASVTTVKSSVCPTGYCPRDVSVGASGDIYFSQITTAGGNPPAISSLRKLHPATGAVTAIFDFEYLAGIAVDPAETYVWCMANSHDGGFKTGQVDRILISSGALTLVQNNGNFSGAGSIDVRSDGRVFFLWPAFGDSNARLSWADPTTLTVADLLVNGSQDGNVAIAASPTDHRLYKAHSVGGSLHTYGQVDMTDDAGSFDCGAVLSALLPSGFMGAGVTMLGERIFVTDNTVDADGIDAAYGGIAADRNAVWEVLPRGGWRTGSIGMS